MTKSQWFWTILAAGAILLGIGLRLHNASVWNPYWGYDGGAHLEYVRILAEEGRMPGFGETYAGWHEPLFYFLAVPIAKIFGVERAAYFPLSLLTASIGILTLLLLAWFAWQRTKRASVVALTLLLTAALPVALSASTFFSNEGLAHLLILLVLFVLTSRVIPFFKGMTSTKSYALLSAILLGLALLTKLTAFVALFAIALWYLLRLRRLDLRGPTSGRKGLFFEGFLIAGVALLIASPWFIHKTRTIGGVFVNPFEQAYAREQLPRGFFTSVDKNIFHSPFWPAGSNSFWSVVFASTVTDYDHLLKNPDEPDLGNAALEKNSVFFGTLLVPVFLFALGRFSWRVIKRRRADGDALILIFLGGSLSALVLNTIRYGSIERGNVKPFFILSAILLAVLITAEQITDPELHPRLRRGLMGYALVAGTLFALNSFALGWV